MEAEWIILLNLEQSMKADLLERLSFEKEALNVRAPCSYRAPIVSLDLKVIFTIFSCLGTQAMVVATQETRYFLIWQDLLVLSI